MWQPAGDVRADQVGEPRLDVSVNVLQLGPQLERASFELSLDQVKALEDALGVGGIDDPALPEHARVRPRAGDVLAEEHRVDADRRCVGLNEFVGFGFEATAPEAFLSVVGRSVGHACSASLFRPAPTR